MHQRPLLRDAQISSDLVLVVSDPLSVKKFSETMSSKTKAKFVDIGSPINLSKFDFENTKRKIENRKNRKATNFLYTGRLSKFKDVKTLVDAMKLYIDHVNNNAELVIAGSGPEYENLSYQIENFGLKNNIKLLGPISHDKVYDYLNDADMFLTASGGEGVSVSVLEAYASGLPVVCFRVPGLEGQIKDKQTGIFATERSSEAFYRAILELDKIRTECSINCLEEAKKYDSRIIANKIITEIERLNKE